MKHYGLVFLAACMWGAIVASIEPVVASLLATTFYGEQLSFAGYSGAMMVVGRAIASSLPESHFFLNRGKKYAG